VIWMASLRRSPNFSSLNTLFSVYICCFPRYCIMRRTPYKKMFFHLFCFLMKKRFEFFYISMTL
jgi:hypothetical protein